MGWFDSIVKTVKRGATKVYRTAVKPTYNKIVKPVLNTGIKVAKSGLAKARAAEARVEHLGGTAISSTEGLLKNIASPTTMYIALGIGGLVALSYLKSK